ncbi:MAG: carboxypeptidase-like regulatory domain-containing protein [Cellvibrionaceae bacterium]
MSRLAIPKKNLIYIALITIIPFLILLYFLLTIHPSSNIKQTIPNIESAEVSNKQDSILTQGWIIGSVSSKSRQVLSAIQVCAYGNNPVMQTHKKCQSIKSNGQFEMALEAGEYELVVTANQHRSEKLSFNITPGLVTDALFNLEFSDRNIQGIVYSASGETVDGVEITIIKDGEKISESLTDNQGKFQAWSPNGPIIITAKSPNYAQAEVFTSSPSHDVSIKLFPGFSVQGTVISKTKGEPLSGIKVVANTEDTLLNDRSVFTTTDNNGDFILYGLDLAESYLRIFDEIWTVEKSVLVDGKNYDNKKITIVAEKGQAFTGQLNTNNGPCISGQTYLAPVSSNNNNTQFLTQSETGTIYFPALPIGSYNAMSYCENHIFAKGPSIIDLKNTKGAEWYFESGLSLEVLVKNEAGQPVHNATLNLTSSNNQEISNTDSIEKRTAGYNISAITDENGYHKFGGLLEGEYTLNAGPPGLNAIEPASQVITLFNDDAKAPIKFIIAGQGTISIKSETENNLPNSRTFFYAQNKAGERFESLYSGDGQYNITPLPLGRYQVFAYDNKNPKIALKHNNEEWISIENSQSIELTHTALDHAGEIKGTVYDHTGAFASNIEIRAISETLTGEDAFYSTIQEIMHGKQSSLTDKNGKFIFSGLAPNEAYQLLITSPEGTEINKAGIFPGEELNISLPQPQIFKGKVLLSNGTPSREFTVQLLPESGEPIVQFFESSTGEFSLTLGELSSSALIRIIPESNTSYIEEEIQLTNSNDYKVFYLNDEK